MGKLKSLLICAAAVTCPIFISSDNNFGSFLRSAAYISAGVYSNAANSGQSSGLDKPVIPNNGNQDFSTFSSQSSGESYSSSISPPLVSDSENSTDNTGEPEQIQRGQIIRLNESQLTDDTDYSKYTEHSGAIRRFNYGKYSSSDYIDLPSGAQVRNCTEVLNSTLEEAAKLLPDLPGEYDPSEPQVLIYHTHTTESFLPEADWYDDKYPTRSFDSERNVTAVGDALCEALAKRGISSVHDCTVHDYPSFTGAYANSAETIKRNLEQYPSIKIVIDLHRDGIVNTDGSLSAPVAEINGKNAAQFMIISGCDDGTMDMPNYIENFKLACLLQNCAENAYPELARAVLFDYRRYNQHLSSGALLIEVGSHGNSLGEVVYTGELLGNVIADALQKRFEG